MFGEAGLMPGKTSRNIPDPFRSLRKRAEDLLRANPTDMASEDIHALIHELGVHQVELEIQNEELRQAQVELAETRDRYVDLYEFAPVGYVTLDNDGKILEANLTAARLLDVEREALLAGNLSNFVAPQSQDDYFLHRREVFSCETKQICELEMRRADGKRPIVRLDSIAFGRDHDRLCRTSLSDVTARKDAEAATSRLNRELEERVAARTAELQSRTDQLARKTAELEKQRREFRALADNVPALFSYVDRERRYRYVNSRYEELLRRPLAEIVGKTIAEVLGPERFDTLRPYVDAALSGNEVRHEVELEFADGSRTIDVRYVPDRDEQEGVRGFFALGIDVTEKKRAEERLLQSERLAVIGETVAGLAHESRNALQRSQAGIERLSRRLKDDPGSLQIVEQIQKAQDDLHRIYEEVREYAAPIGLKLELCRLTDVITEAWEDLGPTREQRQASLRQETGDIDLDCMIDRELLRRVVRNVLENSVAATQSAAEPLEILIRYSIVQTEGEPVLSISLQDNGPGLSPEVERRIFDAFYTTKTHGTGLGMAISKRIVEAHGGKVRVGTGDGAGAEIVIWLPWRTE